MTNNGQDINEQPSVTFSKVAKTLFDISSMRTKAYVAGAVASAVVAARSAIDLQLAFGDKIRDLANGVETAANSGLGTSGLLTLGFGTAALALSYKGGASWTQDRVAHTEKAMDQYFEKKVAERKL